MLDDTGDGGKSIRQRFRIGNPLKGGIENPVPAIRDESVAVLGPPQRRQALCSRRRRRPASTARRVAPRPNGTTSIGSGNRPSIGTHFDSSAMTIMRADAAATIFSRSRAPPPPLIRLRSGAISSAPSTVRSSSGVSSRVGQAARRAARRRCASRSEVGTATTSRPARTRSAKQLDEMPRRRAGAQAEPHAGPDEFDRAGGGGTFLGIDVHRSQTGPLTGRDGLYLAPFRT